MILAIDVGGTKMAAALVAPDGAVRLTRRLATPQDADAETLWKTLLALIEPYDGFSGVGVGCGGPMAWPSGEVSPLNIPGWRGFPLGERLAARFPGKPVRIHNDAICLAVAEHWKGHGRGRANMLGMVVSTGVGGGLILGDRLVNGGTGNAGHIGHVIVEPGGPPCGCGGHGCLEAVARGPALVAWAQDQGWTPSPANGAYRDAVGSDPEKAGSGREKAGSGQEEAAGSGLDVAGAYREDREATGQMLAADARRGDPIARAALARAGHALGLAIASATHLCDLDVVTIGGGLSQSGELLFGPLERTLREHARMDFARRLSVVPALLGQEAGLVGAAALLLGGDRYWAV
ncbi:ROK family protein [Nonomuraea endophytica]|uniref:Glucokinase n=1 Tax=Nonomuraea endophytica TaxID=714136 RepID=A0A7W8EHC8_9ACTN|nr:ROK family protein [Nonomuraea endophytica]MBB5080815.1 glucokinase [Nonomuraea endophytica]